MKRVVALLLCLLLAFSTILMTACDEEVAPTPNDPNAGTNPGGDSGNNGNEGTHVHTFKTDADWSYDANSHWYEATCDCADVTLRKLNHVDDNKDGACDVCKYSDHEHTYAEEWTVDCTNHWNAADCGCIVAGANVEAHADSDNDGICDECGYMIENLHNHYYATEWSSDGAYHWHAALCEHGVEVADKAAHELNAAGYCTVCDAQVKQIDMTDFLAVLSAAVANNHKVVSGNVIFDEITDGTAKTNKIYYVLGNGDSYIFYKTFNANGDFLGGDQQWYETISEDEIFGVQMVAGTQDLIPAAGAAQFLNGYNYMPGNLLAAGYDDTSTLAQTIYNMYDQMTNGANVSNVVKNYDAETGIYTFSYTIFHVDAKTTGGEVYEYAVELFDVAVEFRVDANYVINVADITVESYRNWELDMDLDYDPTSNTVTLRDSATATTYAYNVGQTSGERTYTTIYPKASFMPVDFEMSLVTDYDWGNSSELIILDEELITSTVTIEKGKYTRLHLGNPVPASALLSFMDTSDFEMTFVNKDPSKAGELWSTDYSWTLPIFSGYSNCIAFTTKDPGEYTVTIRFGQVTKTIDVIVPGEEPIVIPEDTADTIYVQTTDTYGWFDEKTFTATESGTYTFTIPEGLGFMFNNEQSPRIDYYDAVGGTVTFDLAAGDSVTFTVGALTKDLWSIGVSFVAGEVEGGDQGGEDIGGGDTPAGPVDITGTYNFEDGLIVTLEGTNAFFTYNDYSAAYTYTVNGDDVVISLGDNALSGSIIDIILTDGVVTGAVYNGNSFGLASGGGDQGGEDPIVPSGPDGSEENPYIWNTLPGEVTINSDTMNMIFYQFVAPQTGVVTFTWPTADSWASVVEMINGQPDNENYLTIGETETFSFNVVAGSTYRVALGTYYVPGECTITISIGDAEQGGNETPEDAIDIATLSGSGTKVDPYVITAEGKYFMAQVNSYPGQFITFTAPSDMTIILTADVSEIWTPSFSSKLSEEGVAYEKALAAGETLNVTICLDSGTSDVILTVAFGNGEGGEGGEGGEDPIVPSEPDGSQENPYIVTDGFSMIIATGYYNPTYVLVNAGVTATIDSGAAFFLISDSSTDYVGTTVTPDVDTVYGILADSSAGAMCQLTGGSATGGEGGNDPAASELIMGHNSVSGADIAFTYTATEAGTLTLAVGGTGVMGGTVELSYTVNGGASTALALNATTDITLNAGDVIVITAVATDYTTITASWAAEGGDEEEIVGSDLEGSGTTDDPYVIPELGDYVCAFHSGSDAIWFAYTATANGYLTVSTTFGANGWLQMGADPNATTNNVDQVSYAATGEPVTIYVFAGTTYYIGVGNWDYETSAAIPFSVSFEAFESESHDHLVGDWTGSEVFSWGEPTPYTMTVNADGTGVFSIDYGYTVAEYSITFILVDGEIVTVYMADEWSSNSITFLYDAEAGTLINAGAWSTITLTMASNVEGSGTQEDPYSVGANNSCQFPGGVNYVFYAYTANTDGTLTVTFTGDDFYWIYGIDSATEMGTTATADIALKAGETVLIGVSTNSQEAGTVTFTVAFDSDAEELVIGNNQIEGFDVTYAYTATEDIKLNVALGGAIMGMVEVTYSVNGAPAEVFELSTNKDFALVAGDTLIITVVAEGYSSITVSEVVEISGTPLQIGNTQIQAADETFVYTATEDIKLNVALGGAVMGMVEVTYSVNGAPAEVFELSTNKNFELAAGDTLVITVVAEGYSSITVSEVVEVAETPLEIGKNQIEAADVTFAYTATEDIKLNVALGSAVMGMVEVTYSVNGAPAEVFELSTNKDFELAAGDKLVITVVAEGYATITVAEATDEGGEEGDEEGGETTGAVSYIGANGSGRAMKVTIDAEAGTMSVIRAALAGNSLDTATGATEAIYTYEFDGTTVTTTLVSGQSCTFTFDANGAPVSVIWGTATYTDFVAE